MKVILIRVPAAEQDCTPVNQLRDFAKGIYQEFGLAGIAEVPETDSTIGELRISIPEYDISETCLHSSSSASGNMSCLTWRR